MNLLRTHQYDDTVKVAVREVYPISYAAGSGSLESEIDMKEEVILLQTFLQQSTSSDRVEMEKDEEETEKEAEKEAEEEAEKVVEKDVNKKAEEEAEKYANKEVEKEANKEAEKEADKRS